MRGLIVALILFLAAAAQHGCAVNRPGGAGAGGGDFSNGLLLTRYGTDVATTYEAAVKALTDLGMTIRNSNKDGDAASIQATRPDDMAPVAIQLAEQRYGMTGATIKVGDSGNEGYSRVIAERIDARLQG